MSLSAKVSPFTGEDAPRSSTKSDSPVALITSLRPVPKIAPGVDLTVAAEREAEVVIRRAQDKLGADSFTALHQLGDQIAMAYDQALQSAATAFSRGADTLRELGEARPEKFIAVVAGIAFVTGIGLRLWRSHA